MDLTLLQHPLVKAGLAGLLGAAASDFAAFRSWKTNNDVLTYAWGVALIRWTMGAALGALSAAGITAVT